MNKSFTFFLVYDNRLSEQSVLLGEEDFCDGNWDEFSDVFEVLNAIKASPSEASVNFLFDYAEKS